MGSMSRHQLSRATISLEGAGVAGFGDPSGSGPGVVGTGRGSGAPGVQGIGAGGVDTVSISACGVYGQAGSGNSNGVEGRGSGNFAGVAGFGDVSLRAAGGIGVFAVGGAPAPASGQPGGPGVYAVGFGGPGYTPLNQTAGVYGIGGAGNGPGILGQGGSAVADGVQGFSGSGNGVSGQSGTGVGVRASSGSATGLVAEGNIGLIASTIAPAGTAGQFDGNVVISGNLTVGGAKSAAVSFPDGSYRRLYCVESPENWFEDFGFGELSTWPRCIGGLEWGLAALGHANALSAFGVWQQFDRRMRMFQAYCTTSTRRRRIASSICPRTQKPLRPGPSG